MRVSACKCERGRGRESEREKKIQSKTSSWKSSERHVFLIPGGIKAKKY